MGLRQWLDRRLGSERALAALRKSLTKPLPGHVGWLWTLGSTAALLLVAQVVTGALLMIHYQPSAAGAHESVRRITEEVPLGWLVRGLHVWGSHVVIVVLLLHMGRVFGSGGYKKPRELTWMAGVLLLGVVLAFGLTGYLLPWSQLSYWATTVVTDGAGALPLVGDLSLTLLRGGKDVTEATLGRFFVAHVWLLPAILVALMGLHIFLVDRLGIAPPADADTEEKEGYAKMVEGGRPFWPDHVSREATVGLVAIAAVATLACLVTPELGEKADPYSTPPGIKPEWYFLPVYQLQKYFPPNLGPVSGRTAGVVFVSLGFVVLLLLPFLDRSPERCPARRKKMLVLGSLVILAMLVLGALGHYSDRTVRIFGKAVHLDTYGLPRGGDDGGGGGGVPPDGVETPEGTGAPGNPGGPEKEG